MSSRRRHILRTTILFGSAILLLLTPSAGANEQADYGYGFYRTVEGKALLSGLEQGAEPLEVEPNYPVLTGDRIWVENGARLEAVLPDRVILRLDQETELLFEGLAGSPDAGADTTTHLGLVEGEIQVTADGYVLSDTISLTTGNSRIYLDLPGTYRLIYDGRGWTEVAVREGFAEVNTERGSIIARDGEGAVVEGEYSPRVTLIDAGPPDALEYWAADLSGDQLTGNGYVDDSLAYAAAPLEDSGEWVVTSGRPAWRPTVRVGWRPFSDGWGVYTPSGLNWVAYEPWGWVTSHYGAWDYVPGYGWLWFPGTTYSPAWVYWYWGPTHAAWIPSGYYTRYYGPRHGSSFRFGVYGWARGEIRSRRDDRLPGPSAPLATSDAATTARTGAPATTCTVTVACMRYREGSSPPTPATCTRAIGVNRLRSSALWSAGTARPRDRQEAWATSAPSSRVAPSCPTTSSE